MKTARKSSIEISKINEIRLRSLGKMGDSFDSVIESLLEHSDSCDNFWSDRT